MTTEALCLELSLVKMSLTLIMILPFSMIWSTNNRRISIKPIISKTEMNHNDSIVFMMIFRNSEVSEVTPETISRDTVE